LHKEPREELSTLKNSKDQLDIKTQRAKPEKAVMHTEQQ